MIRKTHCLALVLLAVLVCVSLAACGGGGGHGEESAVETEDPNATPKPSMVLDLKEAFRSNLKGSQYVYCQISIEAVSEETLAIMTGSMAQIRDIINGILRSKTLEDMQADGSQEALKTEISDKIKEALQIEELKGVYFTQFYTFI